MRPITLGRIVTGSLLLFAWLPPELAAQGTTYFRQIPVLQDAGLLGSRIEVTLAVPEQAGSGLQQVVIDQQGNPDRLSIAPDQVQVVAGERFRLDAAAVPAQVNLDGDRIQVRFDPPLSPGSTATIGIRLFFLPQTRGTYLYGVSALPAGDQPHNYFLGYARVVFPDPAGDQPRLFPLL